jgi:5-methylcytosine-specific restriction endonuclease McrA
MRQMTLVLDRSYKPIDLIPVQDAVAAIAAIMVGDSDRRITVHVEDESRRFRSQYLDIAAPVIIVSDAFVEHKHLEPRTVIRRALFARDNYTCQYCGEEKSSKQLTIDHVKPVREFPNRLSATTWDNCVAACDTCNNRKGGRDPKTAGMNLLKVPIKPHYTQLRFCGRLNSVQKDYIGEYFEQDVAALAGL